jgi:ankyrin repeat protein
MAMDMAMDNVFAIIDEGDGDRLRQLLADDPAQASVRNADGLSPLLAATYRHRPDLAQIVLAAAPPLDVFDAAAVGDVDRLAELLDADPVLANAYASDGFTPLGLAAYFGHPAAVRLLLERGADPSAAARNAMRVQPLHSAVAGRSAEAVRLLLAAGADPNARQHGGWTPLLAAAAHGDEDVVNNLLAAGADAAAVNDAGQDAAALAAEHGHAALAERLGALTS